MSVSKIMTYFLNFSFTINNYCSNFNFFKYHYRPQRSCEAYVFTGVCLSTGGWYPSMPCRWYPNMPYSRSPGGMCYPSMPCRWYPSMPCNRSGGGVCLVRGGCAPGGVSAPRRVPGPGGKGCLVGGCLVWGVCSWGGHLVWGGWYPSTH